MVSSVLPVFGFDRIESGLQQSTEPDPDFRILIIGVSGAKVNIGAAELKGWRWRPSSVSA